MPHFSIKCYPKHLTGSEMKAFVDDLTRLAEKHLKATEEYVSVNYEEIPAEDWKERVFDKEIKPLHGRLAKEPGYEM